MAKKITTNQITKKPVRRKTVNTKSKSIIKKTMYEKYPELKNIVANIVLTGDISRLNQDQRVMYYNAYCESLNLNPLTKPFDIITLKDKTILYPNKECAAQLRELKGISIDSIHTENVGIIYMVVVKGHDKSGKTDCEMGVVSIEGLRPAALADAIMKATTKAKRRLTLSLCGLGGLDETEVERIKEMQREEVTPAEYTSDDLTYEKDETKKTKYLWEEEKEKNKQSTWNQIISFINENQKKMLTQDLRPSDFIAKAKQCKTEEEQIKFLNELKEVVK